MLVSEIWSHLLEDLPYSFCPFNFHRDFAWLWMFGLTKKFPKAILIFFYTVEPKANPAYLQ